MRRDYYIVKECATGGTPTITGSTEFTFLTTNSLSNANTNRPSIILPSGVTKVEYLVIGGGGGGGGASTNNSAAGGGGAGAFIEGQILNPSAGTYSFLVGGQGSQGSTGGAGSAGGNSILTLPDNSTITANGGTGGAGTSAAAPANSNNGSGGGGSSISTGSRNIGAAGGAYGFSGGTATVSTNGAGGGGAGAVGTAATNNTTTSPNGGGAGKTPTYFSALGEIAKGGNAYSISGSANTTGQVPSATCYGCGGGGGIRISTSQDGGFGIQGIIKFKVYWS